MNEQDLRASMASLTGHPSESRTVQAFVAVAMDYADAAIAARNMQMYADVIGALPIPDEPMTVTAFEAVRGLLLADYDQRADR